MLLRQLFRRCVVEGDRYGHTRVWQQLQVWVLISLHTCDGPGFARFVVQGTC